jgi:aryl-alcohol dehydrogenase-like predicted oxidoreductase
MPTVDHSAATAPLQTRRLGRSGIEVTRLGLGGLFVSAHGSARDQGIATIRHAIAAGLRYIDTAPGYADSEAVGGAALHGVDAPVVLSTKLGGRPQPFDPRDRAALAASIDESRRLLGRDVIDCLLIHEPDRPGQYDWWTGHEPLSGPVLDLLIELKQRGVVRSYGLGGTTVTEMARLIETDLFDVVLTAFNYSLLWREAAESVIGRAAELGMGVIAGSPLQQGALAARHDAEIAHGAPWLSAPRREQYRALYAVLDAWSIPIAEAALRFVASDPRVDCILNGARSPAEFDATCAALAQGPLPAEMLAQLASVAAMVPFRPFEEPFGLPFGRGSRQGPGVAR